MSTRLPSFRLRRLPAAKKRPPRTTGTQDRRLGLRGRPGG